MNEIFDECVRGPVGREGESVALGAVDMLSLAGAPTFAFMALLTGLLDAGPPDICSAAQHASPLNGMVVMYALMSAFHAAPWLKLTSSRHGDPGKRVGPAEPGARQDAALVPARHGARP